MAEWLEQPKGHPVGFGTAKRSMAWADPNLSLVLGTVPDPFYPAAKLKGEKTHWAAASSKGIWAASL